MEWVEVHGKSIDVAVDAALEELGLTSREQVEVEVVQEPTSGFLGLGGKDAIVKVTPKPKRKPRRRRRRGGRGRSDQDEGRRDPADRADRERVRDKPEKPAAKQQAKNAGRGRDQGKRPQSKGRGKGKGGSEMSDTRPRDRADTSDDAAKRVEATIEDQAEVAADFVKGLLAALGLEGDVQTRIDDDILYLNVSGDQTEALVGQKGVIMQSVLELTRTVVQRKTHGAPRMRIDIGGYTERRRAALRIYAGKLADQVLDDGEEVMLEPMNAADRKVVHDALAEIDGVRSFSEGEDPHRAVVVALAEGVSPRGAAVAEEEAVQEKAGSELDGSEAADDGATDTAEAGPGPEASDVESDAPAAAEEMNGPPDSTSPADEETRDDDS